MTTRTICFDLDQTLVDSRVRIVESFRSAFRTMGLADVQPAAFDPWFGYPLERILEGVAPGTSAEEFVPRYRHAYDVERPGTSDAMPGARAALEWLRDNDFRTVVISAKLTRAVHVALQDAGLDDLVTASYGDHFGEQKAIPLQQEDAAVYVGDHVADMQAAGLAEVAAIGVESGAHDAEALRQAGAAVVIRTLDGLPDAVTRLLG